VRLDEIFDLRQPGEYSVQVAWPERSTTAGSLVYRESGTNIVSGVATFRIVDSLSPAELEARKAFDRLLEETERKAYGRTHGITHQPPAK